MRILTLVAYYHPGFKAGGPIRTMVSLVEHLGDSFEFWILTADRDYQDSDPYANIPIRQWVSVGNAQVYYVDVKSLSLRMLRTLIDEVAPDIVYLNSLFSLLNNKYLLARRLGLIPQIPTIAAPRGVFSPGALRLKPMKKQMYLLAAQWGGLFKGLHWQASSTAEEKNIRAALPGVAEKEIFVASDMVLPVKNDSDPSDYLESSRRQAKEPGQARFIFLSRITPVKNLDYALALLPSLEGHIKFDLFGPIQDPAYWDGCQEIITGLPPNVQVHYHGPVPNGEVRKLFSEAHFLLLPTLGENFGHVILESLQAGCPVLISDQTPWNGLSEGEAGWVIPLDNRAQWVDTLQNCVDMDQEDFANYSKNAGQYALRQLSSPHVLQANRNMFLTTAAGLNNPAARRA